MEFFYKFFNKKGQAGTDSALVQLFYIILGVFVLLTFVKIIFTFLNLETNTNKEIIEQNGKSINEFIEFSQSKFSQSSGECYTSLKLTNLENFQFHEEKSSIIENYFIIISEKAIYREKIKNFEKFENSPSITTAIKILEFDNTIKIYEDKTFTGTITDYLKDEWAPDLALDFLNENNNKVILKDTKLDYIVLLPVFSASVGFNFDSIQNTAMSVFLEEIDLFEGQNRFKLIVYGDKTTSTITRNRGEVTSTIVYSKVKNGHSLIYKPNEKFLFVSSDDRTEILIFKDLCSYETLKGDILSREYKKKDGVDIDQINNIIYLNLLVDGVESEYSFQWDNGPNCYKNKVRNSCNENYKIANDIEYKDFQPALNKYFLNFFKDTKSDLNWKIDNKQLTIKEIEDKEEKFNHQDMFELSLSQLDVVKIVEIGAEQKNKIYSFEGVSNLNEDINNCDKNICNYLYFDNKENLVYYFDGVESGTPEFRYLNEKYLRKTKVDNSLSHEDLSYNFYLNGKLIVFEVFDADMVDDYFSNDINIYVTKDFTNELFGTGVSKTVALSKEQLTRVPITNSGEVKTIN